VTSAETPDVKGDRSNGNGRAPSRSTEGEGVLLEVSDLRTTFETPRGPARAVSGVSLSVDRGQSLGIVGESGSGKSVFARSVLGLLFANNASTTGSVRLKGRELVGLPPKELRSLWGVEAAMVFQDPMTALNATMKVGAQITESLRHHFSMSRAEAKQHALSLLRSVGIPEPERRFKAYPHELSGGMRQRVTIAIALACGPGLLIADEPTTALDVTIQKQVLDLLAEQQSERNMGLILITHDLGVVAGRTDNIAVMYAGRIVEKAPTRALFRNRSHPYTDGLMSSIPRLTDPGHSRLQTIPGRPPDLTNLPPGCAFAPRCPLAQPLCLEEAPTLQPVPDSPHHEQACHFPLGTAAGDEALARNRAAGETATGLTISRDQIPSQASPRAPGADARPVTSGEQR
jgi:peptide/nickel transport system ATP-binding protein